MLLHFFFGSASGSRGPEPHVARDQLEMVDSDGNKPHPACYYKQRDASFWQRGHASILSSS